MKDDEKASHCFGDCEKGEIYKDPKKRFEVVCPSNKLDTDNLGVYFEDEKNFSFYSVRVYNFPPLHPQNSLTIENVLSDLKSMMQSQATIEVLKEEPMTYKTYEWINFNFMYDPENPLYYYSRLIAIGNSIIWAYFSTPSGPDAVIITNENEVTKAQDIADKFLNSLKFPK